MSKEIIRWLESVDTGLDGRGAVQVGLAYLQRTQEDDVLVIRENGMGMGEEVIFSGCLDEEQARDHQSRPDAVLFLGLLLFFPLDTPLALKLARKK
jgi:hypothetical protein